VEEKSSTRTRRIIIRLSETEYRGYFLLAQNLGTTRARLFRGMVREALELGPDLITQDMKIISEGVYQLAAVGRNLNQELRAMHSGQLQGEPAHIALIEQLKERVTRLEELWIKAIKRSRNRWVPGI
jgi:hypothetical protein